MGNIRVDACGRTDAGRVRRVNEDQFLVATLAKSMRIDATSLRMEASSELVSPARGHLFVIADGVGGSADGKAASTLATETVREYVLNTMPWFFRLDSDQQQGDLEEELRRVLARCHTRVSAVAEERFGVAGMATTLTMAYVMWPRMYVVHVGDSRCYLARNGQLERVTHDHTVAESLREEGVLSEQQAIRWSHVLWNAVGGEGEMRPDVYLVQLAIEDSVLLCTDGLNRHVTDLDINAILEREPGVEAACEELVAAANRGGGEDNISVVLARFRGPDGERLELRPDPRIEDREARVPPS